MDDTPQRELDLNPNAQKFDTKAPSSHRLSRELGHAMILYPKNLASS
jgi:hypothetical protein